MIRQVKAPCPGCGSFYVYTEPKVEELKDAARKDGQCNICGRDRREYLKRLEETERRKYRDQDA